MVDIETKANSKNILHGKIEKHTKYFMKFPKIFLKSINLKTKLFTCGF